VDWNAVTAIATVVSMVAYVVTALYIRAQLKAVDKDRYLEVTNQLFAIWETREFMEAQLWLLHRLRETTWQDFVKAHRAEAGEAAFHRVGSFYDRVGTLIRLGVIPKEEILATVGALAIAVWQRIGPLALEARRLEHSTLFADFERMLPACYECYVPAAGPGSTVRPFSLEQSAAPAVPKVRPAEVLRRLERGEPLTLLDVRPAAQVAAEPRRLPGAIVMPANEVERRRTEVPPEREVVVYCA
jgi:hypothetical protein